MTMSDVLADAIRRAVEAAPCSVSALAREADISQSLLARILTGEKGATPETAAKITAALDAWARRCAAGAEIIRRANSNRRKQQQ